MSSAPLNPYLDFDRPVIKTGHNLPHWHQDNAVQFVSFRQADSLPQQVLSQLRKLRNEFVDVHPYPWDKETTAEYGTLISEKQQIYLDNGLGSCKLRDPHLRDKLIEAIEYFDGIKYDLIAYVIMPNHVHILYRLFPPYTNDLIIGGIKSYSAIMINKLTGDTGYDLWAKNYWDTIIRNYHHLERCINYIRENPKNLKPQEYHLFLR